MNILQRWRAARLLGDMMQLYNNFVETRFVGVSNGEMVISTYWVNEKARLRYEELKKEYDELYGREDG